MYCLLHWASPDVFFGRAFALQRTKPAILRLNIRKPEFHNSDDPVLTYGFLNLINLFEKLPIELYDWICSDKERGKPSGSTMTTNIQNAICAPLLLDGVLETQQVDIRVTQQWLQAVMWKLGLSASVEKLIQTQSILPLNVPLTVGKSVMKTLSFASQSSIDAHGIGMVSSLLLNLYKVVLLIKPKWSRSKNFSILVPAYLKSRVHYRSILQQQPWQVHSS